MKISALIKNTRKHPGTKVEAFPSGIWEHWEIAFISGEIRNNKGIDAKLCAVNRVT